VSQKSSRFIMYVFFLVLLSQKKRIDQGSSRWNLPVPSDNMAIRFKKWIEDAQKAHPVWFKYDINNIIYHGTVILKSVFRRFNSTMKTPSVELTHDIEGSQLFGIR